MYLLASSVKELFVLFLYPTIVLDALMQRADEDVRDPSMQRGGEKVEQFSLGIGLWWHRGHGIAAESG